MKSIENKKWTEKVVRMVDGKQVVEELPASLITALGTLMSVAKQEDVPKGFSQFRSYSRIAKAFDQAEKSGTLELDDSDYILLKSLVDKNCPATWAFKPEIVEAVEAFMDADKSD